ncbi:hypothetical protein D3C78_1746200 [compost metagenome]
MTVNCRGRSANTPVCVVVITLVLPCICCWARMMRPPNAAPMLWWPRHTPRMGSLPAKCLMAATEMPASAGEQGPGEATNR